MPGDGSVHAHLARRVAQGFIRPEEAAQLGERLSAIADLAELGAISPHFAETLIRMIAEEQAALWLDGNDRSADPSPIH